MSSPLELTTSRLTLIPVTLEIIEAEIGDRARLSQLLGAEVPADWPPPLNDENTMRWTRDHLAANPDNGWVRSSLIPEADSVLATFKGAAR